MSNKSLFSNNSYKKKMSDSIPCRIGFIKELIKGKDISPLVNFETTDTERSDLISSLDHIKKRLDTEFSPDSYNIGLNDGQAAGQTVPHLHLHLIPRYLGDCEDPRGGIRWIIPEKARYWE